MLWYRGIVTNGTSKGLVLPSTSIDVCVFSFPRLRDALFGITHCKMTTPGQDAKGTTPTPAMKRKRPNIPSPDAEILSQSKTIDVCGHCNKKCTAKGPQSEALQCDMCHSWVHATCEGLKKDQYKQLAQLSNTITNIAV